MSVNTVNQDGSLNKIAHGFPQNKFDILKSDVANHIETTDMASRDYAAGDVFIMANGHLVRALNDIDEDTTISTSDIEDITVTELLEEKVDKVTGKGLSTNDYTDEDKATTGKLALPNTVVATDESAFLMRQCLSPEGFTGYVREKLIGASYAWNQLVQNGNFEDISNWQSAGVSSFIVSSNVATFTSFERYGNISNTLAVYDNHKYLAIVEVKLASNPSGQDVYGDIRFNEGAKRFGTCEATTNWQTLAGIIHGQARSNGYIRVIDGSTSNWVEIQVRNVRLIDLTLAFGSTIADYLAGLSNNGGITKLREMGCPIDKYTPYGNYLVSTKTSGKKIRGFNQWDEDFSKNDYYILNTGEEKANAQRDITSYISIIPNTTYYFKDLSQATSACIAWYDSNKNFISTTAITSQGFTDTAPSNARYLRCSVHKTMSNTCINISDPNKNGTYEPYSGTTYSLGNDELRGKFDLVNGEIVASGDVKESNGGIDKTYALVALNSLTWTKAGDTSTWFFWANYNSGKPSANYVCAKYTNVGFKSDSDIRSGEDKAIGYGTSGTAIQFKIKDTAYSDATSFTNSLDGLYLVCELATPITEQSTPFADPMSLVGATTEEYIDDRTIPCPVSAERQYMGESDDRIEFPSVPLADGKRVLTSYKSGDETQYVWETSTIYYKEWIAQGDGTTTYGNLLTQLKPYYEALSEDEKTFSKIIIRANNLNSNECLSFVGAYWYSRIGLAGTSTFSTWISMVSFENCTYKTLEGGTSWNNTNAATSVSIALRVVTAIKEN